jgi:DNA-binding protein HU-beta
MADRRVKLYTRIKPNNSKLHGYPYSPIILTLNIAMGTTTTKVDLVNVIAHRTGLTKNETESVVNSLFESIIDSLKAGKRIEIRGFGSFNIRHKNLRQARNPRTGEKVTVEPKNVPAFKISKEFKLAVSESLKSDGE